MDKNQEPVRVLFVCLGNICRSPMAEAIFNHLIEVAQLNEKFYVVSAGTSGYHQGEPYHRDTRDVCEKNNVKIDGISRPVQNSDFEEFDYLLAMDESNYEDLLARCPSPKFESKIKHMLEFQQNDHIPGLNVPDPYYGGYDCFERVFELLEDACEGFLEHVKREHGFE